MRKFADSSERDAHHTSILSMLRTSLLILGGDDAGTGALWAAGQLGLETLLVVPHGEL